MREVKRPFDGVFRLRVNVGFMDRNAIKVYTLDLNYSVKAENCILHSNVWRALFYGHFSFPIGKNASQTQMRGTTFQNLPITWNKTTLIKKGTGITRDAMGKKHKQKIKGLLKALNVAMLKSAKERHSCQF